MAFAASIKKPGAQRSRRSRLRHEAHMRKLLIGVAFAAAWGATGSATAQVYPSRPITMVAPFPAGGSTDTIGRILADGMRGSLGQNVIIENVGGASGNIGVGRVARAAPDGYTLSLGDARLECSDFCAALRPAERFRAGGIDRGATAARHRQEVLSGE
jgi:hypothetical protein